jgi:hypothetical protein
VRRPTTPEFRIGRASETYFGSFKISIVSYDTNLVTFSLSQIKIIIYIIEGIGKVTSLLYKIGAPAVSLTQ